jgi:hypothetical protein
MPLILAGDIDFSKLTASICSPCNKTVAVIAQAIAQVIAQAPFTLMKSGTRVLKLAAQLKEKGHWA